MGKYLVILAALCCYMAAPVQAAPMGGPAALIIDVQGDMDPAIEPYEEVRGGTTLKLGPETELTISHYKSCREVTVRGGSVKVRTRALKINGGKVLSDITDACPARAELADDNTGTGVVRLRDDGPALTLRPRLRIVIVGANQAAYTTATLFAPDGAIVATAPIQERTAVLPINAPLLAPGPGYRLELTGEQAERPSFDVVIQADGARMAVLEP